VYDPLKARLVQVLRRPRPLKPQTERQLAHHLADHAAADVASFLLCARDVLEDHELDILFGPVFTPTVDERAEVADLLFHWRPAPEQVARLVADLTADVPQVLVRLPDGTDAPLSTHEVMVDRFVRLLRLDAAPEPATAAALREVLAAELWPLGVALLCERGMTPAHQRWLAALVNHVSARRPVTRGLLEAAADFAAGQASLEPGPILAAAEALQRATQGTAAYAAAGHAYWSPDVAQHHHYRGQGHVDHERLAQHQADVAHVAALVEDLRTFEPPRE
jgi:hypothetical protein